MRQFHSPVLVPESVGVELAFEVAEALAVAGEEVGFGPGCVAVESLFETDTGGAGDGGSVGVCSAVGAVADLARMNVLDVVAPIEEASVAVELIALPEPWAVLKRSHEVVVVLDVLHSELGLEGQDFVVDVACTMDLGEAAHSDDLADTIDYSALATAVVADIERDPVNLIEKLADRIASTCLRNPLITAATVTVHKPQAPMPVRVGDVAVTLTRSTAP